MLTMFIQWFTDRRPARPLIAAGATPSADGQALPRPTTPPTAELRQVETALAATEKELQTLRTFVKRLQQTDEADQRAEVEALARTASRVTFTLGAIGLLSLVALVWVLVAGDAALLQGALLATLGGMLGSAAAALLSSLDRWAHGWELRDGTKLPHAEPKDKFIGRMAPFFVARPLLGAFMGLVVFLGSMGGFFSIAEPSAVPARLAFTAIIAGFFAKTVLEKLKTLLDSLFGR